MNLAVKRMDNVLIVVDDLEAVKTFFIELGLEVQGETIVEGPAVGSLIGLENVRATLVTLRTPDGFGIELDKFHTPEPCPRERAHRLAYLRGPEGIVVGLAEQLG